MRRSTRIGCPVVTFCLLAVALYTVTTLPTCQPALTQFPAGEIQTFAVAPTGEYLAIGGTQGVYCYHLNDRQLLWAKHTPYAIESLTFDPTGDQLLGRLANGALTVLLWRSQDGRQLHRWKLDIDTEPTTPLNWGPDGKFIILERSEIEIVLLNLAADSIYTLPREEQLSLTGRHDFAWGNAWSSDGRLLAFGTYGDAIELWDVPQNTIAYTLSDERTRFAYGLAFNSNGTTLASISQWGGGLVWDIEARTISTTLEAAAEIGAGGLVWSSDNKWLITGAQSGSLVVWDAATGKIARFLTGHTATVLGLSFRPDNGHLLSASQNEIFEWDVATGTRLDTFAHLLTTP